MKSVIRRFERRGRGRRRLDANTGIIVTVGVG